MEAVFYRVVILVARHSSVTIAAHVVHSYLHQWKSVAITYMGGWMGGVPNSVFNKKNRAYS